MILGTMLRSARSRKLTTASLSNSGSLTMTPIYGLRAPMYFAKAGKAPLFEVCAATFRSTSSVRPGRSALRRASSSNSSKEARSGKSSNVTLTVSPPGSTVKWVRPFHRSVYSFSADSGFLQLSNTRPGLSCSNSISVIRSFVSREGSTGILGACDGTKATLRQSVWCLIKVKPSNCQRPPLPSSVVEEDEKFVGTPEPLGAPDTGAVEGVLWRRRVCVIDCLGYPAD